VKIAMRPGELDLLQHMLRTYVPDWTVWAFGSRVKGKARAYADLDLVVLGEGLKAERAVARLRDQLDESDLPFPVDLLLWSDLPPAFQDVIRSGYVVLQEASKP
jgi:predicted nucleotidyltransferase